MLVYVCANGLKLKSYSARSVLSMVLGAVCEITVGSWCGSEHSTVYMGGCDALE